MDSCIGSWNHHIKGTKVERRKKEGINQFSLYYIYTCHNETPCVIILNKQKCHFFSKTGNRKSKQFLFGEFYQREGRGYKERVCGNIM
jgi:hypothetical protein